MSDIYINRSHKDYALPMARSVQQLEQIPIFIGGTGRCGTTIVGDLLNEHPQVRTSLPTELKFLANPGGLLDITFGRLENPEAPQKKLSIINFRTYQRRKNRERERFNEFFELVWNKWWDIDAPPPHGRGLVSGISKPVLEKILTDFRKNFRRSRTKAATIFMHELIRNQNNSGTKKFWVETTPLNIANANRILKILPNSRFINMIRDPRDVIASLLTKNWGPNNALEGIEWIQKRLSAGQKAMNCVPANQQLTIKLEDLVINNREKTYNSILEFLELSDSPNVRSFFDSKMTTDAASYGRWKNEVTDKLFSEQYLQLVKQLKLLSIPTYED